MIAGGAFLRSRSVTGGIGVLVNSSVLLSGVISVPRYPYSPRLTTDDPLEAVENLSDGSSDTLRRSDVVADNFRDKEPLLESTDDFLSLLAGDKVIEGFLDPEARLDPCSTIDILLSATNDGRLISGRIAGRIGPADSRNLDRPIGCDLASGNEPVGLLI